MLRDRAVAVTVWRNRPVLDGAGDPVADEMGAAVCERVPERVDGVLWMQRSSSRIADAGRPNGTVDEIRLHFPKAYDASLAGCEVEVAGRRYAVVGDPIGYMPELTPGPFNRPVTARRVDG